MALQITADALEDLPEPLRASAKEAGGKFVVSGLPQGFSIEDVSNLKRAVQSERRLRSTLADKLKAYGWSVNADGVVTEDDGEVVDPAKAREALQLLASGSLKSAKEIEDWKAQFEAKSSKERKVVETERDTLDSQVRHLLIDNAAMQELSAAGVKPGFLKSMLGVVKESARIEKTSDGRRTVVLYGDDGKPLMTKKTGSHDGMSLGEFVSTLKENPDFRHTFSGSGAGGSGASSQQGGTKRAADAPTGLDPMELLNRANSGTTAGAT